MAKKNITPEYHSWSSMRSRCNNPRTKSYKYYGARGIKVCERWDSFENFLADMGPRPKGTTIERKDGSKGYEPGNCIWATNDVQARNRRNVPLREFNGENLCLTDIASKAGTTRSRVKYRLSTGRPLEEAADPAPIERDYVGMGPPARIITVHGEEMTIREASAKFNIPFQNLYFRIVSCGMRPEIAVLDRLPSKAFIPISHDEYRAIYNARHKDGKGLTEICIEFSRSLSAVQRICKRPDPAILDGTAVEVPHAKGNQKPVRCIDTGQVFESQDAAAKWAKIKPSNISRACGNGSSAGGFRWEIVS